MKTVVKFIVSILIAVIVSFLIRLPYINIVSTFFDGVVLFSFVISALVLFRPSSEKILLFGLISFGLNYFFVAFSKTYYAEQVSILGYFLTVLYIVLCLREVKSK
jgi:hypothetical protein